MNRKIRWSGYEFDMINSLYEKAETDETMRKMFEQLETNALEEAKENLGLLTTNSGVHLNCDQFDNLSWTDKETVISVLSNIDLENFNIDVQSAFIKIRFSTKIQKLLSCIIFNILNRIEKLDGSINMSHPKWILELQVPVGGKKRIVTMGNAYHAFLSLDYCTRSIFK